MPRSDNRLLASLSPPRLRFARAASGTGEPRLEKVSRKSPTGKSRPFISRKRDSHPLSLLTQRQAGRGRIDWPRGHDGLANRARQSPLAPCDLHSGAGQGEMHTSDEIAPGDADKPPTSQLLLKFVQAFGVQASHTAISNAQSRLDVRLAHWLLMAHDRIGDDTLPAHP